MDSDEDEHEAISKQIIDYYKKYSQNKQLPKYFSGTSVSYMPQIVTEREISKPEIVVEDTSAVEQEEPPKTISPASSVTSNRKLEWDNGADIGYNNCTKLHKSASLPTLTTAQKVPKKSPKSQLTSHVVTVISYNSQSSSSPELNQPVVSSSSSSGKSVEKVFESTTSSEFKPKVATSSSSLASTIAYLKSKIGSPDAESTPKITGGPYRETPILPKTTKRTVHLIRTKPISVECLHSKSKEGADKKIQTSLREGVSKSVQTGDSLEDIDNDKGVVNNQSVIIIDYGNSSSVNTQTGSIASSFEYYEGHKSTTDSSKDTPILGELIAKKQSTSLIADMDKSLQLLQKLLKSKKYDDVTKKRYIKKIVAKIVDNKYKDDSTTSSELFKPRPISKFTVKTFSDEYLPGQNTSSDSYQSWKEDKTLSEKILEEKQKGQGDHLLNFAKKERCHQIAWINDEISHLTKLKGLLEKKFRTTTVYMVGDCSGPSRNPSRNYVIETDLSGTSSSECRFTLSEKDGTKNYHVKEMGKGKAEGRFAGDIEVVSDDNTTNIKVRARKINGCQCFKPKAPSLVGPGKYDTFPKSRTEEQKCWPCGMMKKTKLGSVGTKPYLVEIPLEESAASLSRRVDDLLSKYTAKPCTSDDCKHHCECCKCLKTPKLVEGGVAKPSNCVCCKCKEPPMVCKCKEPSSDNIRNAFCQCDVATEKSDKNFQCTCSTKPHSDNLVDKDIQCTLSTHSQTDKSPPNEGLVQSSYARMTPANEVLDQSPYDRSEAIPESEMWTISSTETSSSTTESIRSCMCCKRKNVQTKNLYDLKKQLSNQAYPLCRPCYRQGRQQYNPNIYANPGHTCSCYTVVQTNTLNAIKKTISELNHIDEEYCTCLKDSSTCQHCRGKLGKTSRNKNGMAYLLTFENEKVRHSEERRSKRKPYLEEIKVKIPVSYKKRHKDRDNKKKKKKYKYSEDSTGDEQKTHQRSLGEYLNENRPEFVEGAEERRKAVTEAKIQREDMSVPNKLAFLQKFCQETCDKTAKKLFTAKEMKEINRRNYQKLPEVQQRLQDNRQRQIKQANRLIVDNFNKKLQENVLKGKRSLPTDVNVVDM